MNYKNMVLIALLFSVTCHSQTKTDRIKKLENDHLEKLLEVKEIERKITNFCEFTDSLTNNYTKQMDCAVVKKLLALKDSGTSYKQIKTNFNDEQIKENFKNEIASEIGSIAGDLYQTIYGEDTFDYDLTQELFIPEPSKIGNFDTLKFLFLKMATERALLNHFVASYQKRLYELCAIGQELATLKQGG